MSLGVWPVSRLRLFALAFGAFESRGVIGVDWAFSRTAGQASCYWVLLKRAGTVLPIEIVRRGSSLRALPWFFRRARVMLALLPA